jgi:hypothetical protein
LTQLSLRIEQLASTMTFKDTCFSCHVALTEANSDISVKDMVAARHKRKVKHPDEFEGLCEDEPGEHQ